MRTLGGRGRRVEVVCLLTLSGGTEGEGCFSAIALDGFELTEKEGGGIVSESLPGGEPVLSLIHFLPHCSRRLQDGLLAPAKSPIHSSSFLGGGGLCHIVFKISFWDLKFPDKGLNPGHDSESAKEFPVFLLFIQTGI